MRKKPYTSSELFDEICKRINLPEILEYKNGSYKDEEIKSYEFDFGNHLEFGGNEGIYLTLYAEYSNDKRILLGTFKTLYETKSALDIMAGLLSDFIFEGKWFVNQNMDDFTWEGFNVKADGIATSYDCATIERARERRGQLLQKYDKVTIFDYAKRKFVE